MDQLFFKFLLPISQYLTQWLAQVNIWKPISEWLANEP